MSAGIFTGIVAKYRVISMIKITIALSKWGNSNKTGQAAYKLFIISHFARFSGWRKPVCIRL